MPRTLLKPALYSESSSGPVLSGGECQCGFKFFPMQRYGCERCGKDGEALSPLSLRGVGTMIASTVVHTDADSRREAPFVVGTIALDDGPIVRTLLVDVSGGETHRLRVEAVLVAVPTESQSEVFDLRFRAMRPS